MDLEAPLLGENNAWDSDRRRTVGRCICCATVGSLVGCLTASALPLLAGLDLINQDFHLFNRVLPFVLPAAGAVAGGAVVLCAKLYHRHLERREQQAAIQ
jgi:hypothetical protein